MCGFHLKAFELPDPADEADYLMLILFLITSLLAAPAVANEMGWQTYCASPSGPQSKDTENESLGIEKLPVDGQHSHSMYLFKAGEELRLWDLVSHEQRLWDGHQFSPANPVKCPPFQAYGRTFEQVGWSISSCGETCESIDIAEGTWPYAFAAADGGVIATTNFGATLLFREGKWCRMKRQVDTYECAADQEMLTEPRKVQFYASVRFQDRTLVGEWPTGRLYEFDGKILRPGHDQPPFVSANRAGYEAQSMAVHCGDLYVGYWPTGDVWRLDAKTREWSLYAELFPTTEELVPHLDRPIKTRADSFYGRRVTALVPHEGALYAATSNFGQWEAGYRPPFMPESEAQLYGAVYRISGCKAGNS